MAQAYLVAVCCPHQASAAVVCSLLGGAVLQSTTDLPALVTALGVAYAEDEFTYVCATDQNCDGACTRAVRSFASSRYSDARAVVLFTETPAPRGSKHVWVLCSYAREAENVISQYHAPQALTPPAALRSSFLEQLVTAIEEACAHTGVARSAAKTTLVGLLNLEHADGAHAAVKHCCTRRTQRVIHDVALGKYTLSALSCLLQDTTWAESQEPPLVEVLTSIVRAIEEAHGCGIVVALCETRSRITVIAPWSTHLELGTLWVALGVPRSVIDYALSSRRGDRAPSFVFAGGFARCVADATALYAHVTISSDAATDPLLRHRNHSPRAEPLTALRRLVRDIARACYAERRHNPTPIPHGGVLFG